MALNEQFDSLDFERLDFAYNKVDAELSTAPRWVDGTNAATTFGGKLVKRYGTSLVADSSTTLRADRLLVYQTLDDPPKVYIVGSFYDTGVWKVRYIRLSAVSPAWTTIPDLRSVNSSTKPHVFEISRGLLFIKSFPDTSGGGDPLGTVYFDGSPATPETHPWGLRAPETAIRIDAVKAFTTAWMSETATVINVNDATGFPSASPPFTIQVGFERMRVTSKGTGLNWTVVRPTGEDSDNDAIKGTEAVEHPEGELVLYHNWAVPDHKVKVELFWRYSFAYESTSGHISNISPYETNPDLLPSSTGPFQDEIPKVTITTDSFANTTEYPYIRIYRTTDGGGKPYFLKRISNTGPSASITFEDKYLLSGSGGTTENDPVPDDQINTAEFGPTLVSNSPPPTVLSPLITGTDEPVSSTPMAYYAGRLWYAIGNVIFFSGQEETLAGIPEHAWPSGTTGNFYRVQHTVTNLESTRDGLYAFTASGVSYVLTGTNLETFSSFVQIFDNCGAPSSHPRAKVKFGNKIALLTHDLRIAIISEGEAKTISDPLGTDLTTAEAAGAEFDLTYFADKEKEYIIVNAHRKTATTNSRQWVYDIRKSEKTESPFWFPPWTIRSTSCISSRINESSSSRRLVWFVWDETNSLGCLVSWDSTGAVSSDYFPAASAGFDFSVTSNLFRVPTGNHVNELRVSNLAPRIAHYRYDRTLFSGDTDPELFYFLDDLWNNPIPTGPIEDPTHRYASTGYRTCFLPVLACAHRTAIKLLKESSKEPCEIQNLSISWLPEAGASEF